MIRHFTAMAAAGLLAGCVAPPFPQQASYPFGLTEAVAASERAIEAETDPAVALARRQALSAVVASRCPDWRDARLRHPLDIVTGNPMPADAVAFGCHNQAALDAMVARRSDLTDPPERAAPAQAAGVNRAAEAYRSPEGPARLPDRSSVVEGL